MENLLDIIYEHLQPNSDVSEEEMTRWIETAVRAFSAPIACTLIQGLGTINVGPFILACKKCGKVSHIRVIGPFDITSTCDDCQLVERRSLHDVWENFTPVVECTLCESVVDPKGAVTVPQGRVCLTCAQKILGRAVDNKKGPFPNAVFIPSSVLSEVLKNAKPVGQPSVKEPAPNGNHSPDQSADSHTDSKTFAGGFGPNPGKAGPTEVEWEDDGKEKVKKDDAKEG